MNEETNILLSELVEAVNRPDWWAIGITAVNALFLGWLAWRQYQLQRQQNKFIERQTKQQEYEVYRSLYAVLDKINHLSYTLLNRVYEYFSYPLFYYMPENENLLVSLLNQIDFLADELSDKMTDFDLKFEHNINDAHQYYRLVNNMRVLLQIIMNFEKDKQIIYIEKFGNYPSRDNIAEERFPIVDAIIEKVKGESHKTALRTQLITFIKVREDVLSYKTLDKIRHHCRVN